MLLIEALLSDHGKKDHGTRRNEKGQSPFLRIASPILNDSLERSVCQERGFQLVARTKFVTNLHRSQRKWAIGRSGHEKTGRVNPRARDMLRQTPASFEAGRVEGTEC